MGFALLYAGPFDSFAGAQPLRAGLGGARKREIPSLLTAGIHPAQHAKKHPRVGGSGMPAPPRRAMKFSGYFFDGFYLT